MAATSTQTIAEAISSGGGGTVKTVNSQSPDTNGNVTVTSSEILYESTGTLNVHDSISKINNVKISQINLNGTSFVGSNSTVTLPNYPTIPNKIERFPLISSLDMYWRRITSDPYNCNAFLTSTFALGGIDQKVSYYYSLSADEATSFGDGMGWWILNCVPQPPDHMGWSLDESGYFGFYVYARMSGTDRLFISCKYDVNDVNTIKMRLKLQRPPDFTDVVLFDCNVTRGVECEYNISTLFQSSPVSLLQRVSTPSFVLEDPQWESTKLLNFQVCFNMMVYPIKIVTTT